MPKAAVKTSTRTKETAKKLLILTDGNKRVLIPTPKNYEAALLAVRRHFPGLKWEVVSLQTDQLAICDNEFADIAPESWDTVIELVSSVFVAKAPVHQCSEESDADGSFQSDDEEVEEEQPLIHLNIKCEKESTPIRMLQNHSVMAALAPFAALRWGLKHNEFELTDFSLTTFKYSDTPASLELHNEHTLYMSRRRSSSKSGAAFSQFKSLQLQRYDFSLEPLIHLYLEFEGQQMPIRMRWDANIMELLTPLASLRWGLRKDDFKLVYEGRRFSYGDTPQSVELENSDILYMFHEQRGGKPVIYLYSPMERDVSVALTLTPEWSFSAVYPVVPTKPLAPRAGERIQWNVRTHPNGNLTESNTGLDVAYLYWEAHTNHELPISPPASPIHAQAHLRKIFSHLTSDLNPTDSVLVRVSEITPYLDKVLLALGLHTEARTSFITYWLPSFLKHTHVALRFVPQEAYEVTATLDIDPAPDVVTRVFILFKGVPGDALDLWKEARPTEDCVRWRETVGVDFDRAADVTLFRVLEWGGMEVVGR